MTHCMVLVTCATEPQARTLGSALVEERLAACVQIHPVTSIYTWQGTLHTEPEHRLVIKTRESLYKTVEAYIQTNHGYEVPQIVKIPLTGGLAPYLDWVDQNTKTGQD